MDPVMNHARNIQRKIRKKEKEEIRAPDVYKTETLMDPIDTLVDPLNHIHLHSFQENSCELEKAKLESLEESWKYQAACQQRWSKFQPILGRLQRLGAYDKNIKTVYDLLSVALYRDSYHVDTSITEEEYIFIDKQLQLFRMTSSDKTNLYDSLNRLRLENENN
jgi:hypothetical protein